MNGKKVYLPYYYHIHRLNIYHYIFQLYALDVELDLKEGATKAEVVKAMAGHIIDQTELVGLYKRGH